MLIAIFLIGIVVFLVLIAIALDALLRLAGDYYIDYKMRKRR